MMTEVRVAPKTLTIGEVEQVKLLATFYNNLAIGSTLGGFFIPYLGIASHVGDILKHIHPGADIWDLSPGGPFVISPGDVSVAFGYISSMLIGLYVAYMLRRFAVRTMSLLDDPDEARKRFASRTV